MENFIVKSAFGFIGGILLTYICFMFLVFSLNFTLKRATYICIGLGIILSLGLAFSVKIRCTVFLCIPQLFSKRGRQALLAYAFILALSGPAKNTLHNVEVMSESLACGQEQLKQAENEVLKCVQKPNAAARKSIEKLLEKINSAVQYFKNFIFQLYRTSFDILETVLHAQKWLYSISLLCRKKTCRPTQRCYNLLYEAIENCKGVKLFEGWNRSCQIDPSVIESICFKNSDTFCPECDVAASFPVTKLQKQLICFKNRATNIYSVKIEAHQTYSQYNRTNIYHEEYQGMATEIRQKTDQFLQYFDFMSVIFGIFILVLFVKVIIYRHKFLTEDQYDNRFITSDFVDIDNARAEFQMETLLPLAQREKMKYIKVTSLRLVPCEKVRLLSSFVFLIFATFKIIIHMLTDSSLYWILSSVRQNERLLYMSTIRVESPSILVRIMGNGLIADFIRNVSSVVEEHSTIKPLDPTPCLPDPVPPDWNRYYQILALVLICWLLALCEPYGLRLRHSVMVTYHPDRARERAIWLYNKILSNRICFVKVARKELRKKYKDIPEDVVCSFQFLSMQPSLKCLLCNVKLTRKGKYFKCQTFRCVGMFCSPCFESLKFCSICHYWGDCGDTSELSEERDSSDEDVCRCSKPKPKKPALCSTVCYKSFPLELKKVRFKLRNELFFYPSVKKSPECREQKQERKSRRERRSKKRKVPSHVVTPTAQDSVSPKPIAESPRPGQSSPEGPRPFQPDPKTLQIAPVQFEVFEMRKTKESPPNVESSDWGDDSDSLSTFYVCSNTSLENTVPPEATQEVDDRREPQVGHVGSVSEKAVANEAQVAVPVSPKTPSLSGGTSHEEVAEKRMDQKKHLTWANPTCSFSTQKERVEEEKPMPDFLFKERNNASVEDDANNLNSKPIRVIHKRSRKSISLQVSEDDLNLEVKKGVKDLEETEEKKITKVFENKEDEDLDKEKKKEEIFAGFWVVNNDKQQREAFKAISYGLATSLSDSSTTVGTTGPSNSLHSTHRSACFPSIDPLSISQFIPRSKIQTPSHSKEKKFPSAASSATRRPARSRRLSIRNANLSSSQKICSRKDDATSSEESDGQFYSQPYISHGSKSESSILTNIDLRRTRGNLTVKIAQKNLPKFYCLEKDGSKEKCLSAKPTRRGEKTGSNWSERKASPPSSSSSWEERISEKGFREVRRKPSRARTEGHKPCKKSSQLSWAPDLLSDLPSSKPNHSDTSSD